MKEIIALLLDKLTCWGLLCGTWAKNSAWEHTEKVLRKIFIWTLKMPYAGNRGQFKARSCSTVMVMNRWAGYED
jgi:hypothetical protein